MLTRVLGTCLLATLLACGEPAVLDPLDSGAAHGDAARPLDAAEEAGEDAAEPADAGEEAPDAAGAGRDARATLDAAAADVGGAVDAGTPGPDASLGGPDASLAGRDAGASGGADASLGDTGPASARQTARVLGTYPGQGNGYYEYLPPGYETGPARPLLVFWHGVGENGAGTATDLPKVLKNGPPKLINANKWPAERPFVVLSPQHPGSGCPSANEVRDFFTFAQQQYRVDLTRLYLTGLSCGAIGSWNYLGSYTDQQVAAAVLIAGDGRSAWNKQKCTLGTVAIWGFHGDADGTVAPAGTIEPMTNLIACPAPPRDDAVLTVYPGVGHDSWTRTYDLSAGHDVYGWLLQFTH